MAVEKWIDAFTKMIGTIKPPSGEAMHSYSLFGKSDFPETITKFPSALNFVTGTQTEYSMGGPNYMFWEGETELHLFPDIKKTNYPKIMVYYKPILKAFAEHVTLGGKVVMCHLRQEALSIEGPIVLSFGNDDPHHALRIYWTVKERLTAEFTFGG